MIINISKPNVRWCPVQYLPLSEEQRDKLRFKIFSLISFDLHTHTALQMMPFLCDKLFTNLFEETKGVFARYILYLVITSMQYRANVLQKCILVK